MENSSDTNTKRIAKNTLMLYFRQILIMLVSLYTVRVVLRVLGAEDYGIYNVVAGVVTMFSFLSGAMATASQRYFSFHLGKNDTKQLNTVFSVTFQIYILLAIIVVVLAETFGLWFVNHKLVIPFERMTAANWIFQVAIISFLLTLITTPYMASILAHENMNVYAYVSIVEAGLKLGIVFLIKVLPYDKLIVYGILLTTVAFINTSIYRLYCHKHYTECKFHFEKNGALFKEIVNYSGWNLFGGVAAVAKVQLINVLLNLFFGPIVNAARGVAAQINNAVSSFSQNFSMAIRPQIIKNYASQNYDECYDLVLKGSRFTFYLMFLFTCPLLIELPFVLKLWLDNVPDNTVLFTRLLLIEVLIDSFSYPVMTLSQATGKIRLYQGVVGGVQIMNLPVSFIVLKLGAPAYSVMVIGIIFAIIATFCRLFIVKLLTKLSVLMFFKKVIIPCIVILLLSIILPILFHMYILQYQKNNLAFLNIIFTVFIEIIVIMFLGLKKQERVLIINKIKEKLGVKNVLQD